MPEPILNDLRDDALAVLALRRRRGVPFLYLAELARKAVALEELRVHRRRAPKHCAWTWALRPWLRARGGGGGGLLVRVLLRWSRPAREGHAVAEVLRVHGRRTAGQDRPLGGLRGRSRPRNLGLFGGTQLTVQKGLGGKPATAADWFLSAVEVRRRPRELVRVRRGTLAEPAELVRPRRGAP